MTDEQKTRKRSNGGNSCLTCSLARFDYVTEALNAGQPKEVTADRVDMTHDIMEKHYDKATKNEQMDRKEEYRADI